MIVLVGTRLNVQGRILYRLYGRGETDHPQFSSEDPAETAKALAARGIEAPERIVAHARDWGVIELAEPD